MNLDNKRVRRFLVGWAVALITTIVIWTWLSPPDIPTGTATLVISVIGMLATVLGFYQWSRKKDDEAERRTNAVTTDGWSYEDHGGPDSHFTADCGRDVPVEPGIEGGDQNG